MSIPKKSNLIDVSFQKKKTKLERDTIALKLFVVFALDLSSPEPTRKKRLDFFHIRTLKNEISNSNRPLCLEILTLMFSILARYQRVYNFNSMPKQGTVRKHTGQLRMQMQTWVYG